MSTNAKEIKLKKVKNINQFKLLKFIYIYNYLIIKTNVYSLLSSLEMTKLPFSYSFIFGTLLLTFFSKTDLQYANMLGKICYCLGLCGRDIFGLGTFNS